MSAGCRPLRFGSLDPTSVALVSEPSLSGLAADCPVGFPSNSQGLYYATNVNAVSLARPYVLIASAVADTWTFVHLWA